LSGAVTFRVFALGVATVTDDEEVVRLVLAVLGNAHNGAGSVASGPATNAVRSNFLREKLLFVLLFMDETSVVE
jgi:hypothetical protein